MASGPPLFPSCPLCLQTCSEPVVLSCSHTFCRPCVDTLGTQNPKCPLCRRRDSLERLPPAMSPSRSKMSPPLCLLHWEELRLFCTDHQEALCEVCKEEHTEHRLRPIEEAVRYLRHRVDVSLSQLKTRLQVLERTEQEFGGADGFISAQAKSTETLIQEQFEKLRQALSEEEQRRISAVREEEEEKRKRLEDKMAAVRRQRKAVAETIEETQDLTRTLSTDQPVDTSLLDRYRSIVETAERPLVDEADTSLSSDSLINESKHLGNLCFNIWTSLKTTVQFWPVILDPNTAHSHINLSQDLTQTWFGSRQTRPQIPQRLRSSNWAVLGSEGFTGGVHSWDVEVGKNQDWELGVATKTGLSEDSKSGLSETTKSTETEGGLDRVWRLWFWRGRYRWWTQPGCPTPTSPEPTDREATESSGCEVVRVVLDQDRGQLQFFDADSDSLIHSFSHSFSGLTLFPYIYTHDHTQLRVQPQRVNITVDQELKSCGSDLV